MSTASNQDLSLKLRLKRIFYLMGYYCPLEVDLSDFYPDEKGNMSRRSLTDLDVLGVRYNGLLMSHTVVGDCKSGKVSDSNRLFWLKGVSDFFGADTAYYLRPKIGAEAKTIAPKLGLRVLDEDDLTALENNLNVDRLLLPLADEGFYNDRQRYWGHNIAKGATPTQEQLTIKSLYTYLSYLYWYIEPHRNLFSLINRFSKAAMLLKTSSNRDVLLAYVGLERFVKCLLDMGSAIQAKGLTDVERSARVYLNGGSSTLKDREDLVGLISEMSGTKVALDPAYLPDILELVNRMIKHPVAASSVLVYLEAIYGWCVQLGNSDPKQVFPGELETGTIVMGRDMARSFCKATGMNDDLYHALLSM